MANNNKNAFLDDLIEIAEDGLKAVHRAASAKNASWSPEDRKALKEWSGALSNLTTIKAMREAEERGDLDKYAFGMPDYYRHGYYNTDWAGNMPMRNGNRGGSRSTAYGIGTDDWRDNRPYGHAPDDVRRRVIADLTRMRDAAPDEHTRAEYARMLSHEYGIT